MDYLTGFAVGLALGVIAGRFYWNRVISFARAQGPQFRAWVANEFHRL
jgi:hypothetical protein